MRYRNRTIAAMLVGAMTIGLLSGCGSGQAEEKTIVTNLEDYEQDYEALEFDSAAWNYDADNNVYWQIQVAYCTDADAEDYETMGIYVPGEYLTGTENDDGTYTCTVNASGTVGVYTAQTAPIVFPVNTAGYSAQSAPTDYNYESMSDYLKEGFVYVYAGMRGRENGYDENENLTYSGGAPWGVTDLKAAVRYYRYNQELLPGDTESIFTFGHSGGGAQSAVMGASGDSEDYYTYLMSIGAAMFDENGEYLSDSICGAMCWCPITSLDYADAAYEWNMGQYCEDDSRSDDTWTSALSDDLAEVYAEYINELKLSDEDGNVLVLEESEDGIYASGSYYDYLLTTIEDSLNHFLEDTEFPYTESAGMTMADGGFGGGMPDGEMPSGEKPDGEKPDGKMPSGEMPDGEMPDGAMPGKASADGEEAEAATYETAKDYIDALNEDGEWISYDEETNTVSITSVADFVTHCKKAGKTVSAFDALDSSEAENNLFGNDESDSMHFDDVILTLLQENEAEYAGFSDWDESIIEEFESDLAATDCMGNDMQTREDMYNPMYYLSEYYEGYKTSTPATHWRIRSGIDQSDTALTVEMNLALALEQYDNIKSVDFETVWGQGHTTAERTGDSTENFIHWVNECMGL